ADYVPKELREEWLAKDPIKRFEEYLTRKNILTEADKADIAARVKATVNDAVAYAEQGPDADPATVADFEFAPDGPIAIVGEPGAEDPRYINALDSRTGKPFTTMAAAEINTSEEVVRL
ncbi:MAG TPA: thiamine pyrophosphate-dependent enzyme, partial [Ktedonobacteraceae bacterium]